MTSSSVVTATEIRSRIAESLQRWSNCRPWYVVPGLWSLWSVVRATSTQLRLYTTALLRRRRRLRSLRTTSRRRLRITAILDFMGPIMGFLKSPCTTSYIVNRDDSSKLLSF